MKYLNTLKDGFLAGVMISLGGMAYLSCSSKILGAFLFPVGLLFICIFGFALYTGRIAYVFENKNPLACFIMWLGNLLGCVVMGLCARICLPDLVQTAQILCQNKLQIEWYRVTNLGFFCGILVYISVDNFKNNSNYFAKCLGIFICIPVFILCGFEHCIADMFYFSLGVNTASGILNAFLFCILVTLSNSLGSLFFHYARKEIKGKMSK